MCISILILTLNEEVNLPDCLRSVAWSDDIVVFDSYSSDKTEEIARAAGARFIQRRFDNYSAHRDYARREITFKHPWVFSIDADERMPTELQNELQQVIRKPDTKDYGAFQLRYKNMFFGRWIKHATLYPTWITRFFRPTHIRYEARAVNAHPIVQGKLGQLQGHFEHYTFNNGFAHWFDKHNRYSTMEAEETLKALGSTRIDWAGLTSREPIRQRRALKNLSFHLPARPLIKFTYMALARGGILDGCPGITYCLLQAIYEYMIELKVKELRLRADGRPV